MRFILGVICGLILGGGGYAVAQWQPPMHQGPVTVEGMMHRNQGQPQLPQTYMDLGTGHLKQQVGPNGLMDMSTGQVQQLVPLNQRNPC